MARRIASSAWDQVRSTRRSANPMKPQKSLPLKIGTPITERTCWLSNNHRSLGGRWATRWLIGRPPPPPRAGAGGPPAPPQRLVLGDRREEVAARLGKRLEQQVLLAEGFL